MQDDRTYYERRLWEEMERCMGERNEALRALHREWAQLYRDRLDELTSAELSRGKIRRQTCHLFVRPPIQGAHAQSPRGA